MTKSIADIIALKRDGNTMSNEDIETWIEKLLANEITDAQLGALQLDPTYWHFPL